MSHHNTFSVQTIRPHSTHARALSCKKACTLSIEQCYTCFVAWGITLHSMHRANYPFTQYTCMCRELEDGLHKKCRALLQWLCCTLHYIRCADYPSTQYTCMCIDLEDGVHTKYRAVFRVVFSLGRHTTPAVSWRMVSTLSVPSVAVVFFCLGRHSALNSVCRLSVKLVHMYVQSLGGRCAHKV